MSLILIPLEPKLVIKYRVIDCDMEGSMNAWYGNYDPATLTSYPESIPRAFECAHPNPSFHLWL